MQPLNQPSDKGILKAEEGFKHFALARFEPDARLAPFLEHYWVIRWDLRGQAPYRQTILSYPNVNLSFEWENGVTFAGLYGIPKATYTRHLEGEGHVLGMKFRPGGFYPFCGKPVSQLTGETVPLEAVFGEEAHGLAERLFALDSEEARVRAAEQFLLDRLPAADPDMDLVQAVLQKAIEDRSMVRVEDMAAGFGLSTRSLQRLFHRYVGVTPKWVIQRYRLQEAAELMEKGAAPDWARLSLDLGYYDQAHFSKDFKAMIGKSPQDYVRDAQLF
ncbi:helix-turn-helix domain-containing protein [Paenibacillus sp. CC-CFT747]|nr:helix-turn-helix domain-containing protein [Paenibacillus sp. CC-CFT747]